MKKVTFAALLAATLSLGALAGCGNDSPQALDPDMSNSSSDELAENDGLDPSYSYLLSNMGQKKIRMGYNDSAKVSVKFTYANTGGGVPDVNVEMQLTMKGEKTASFSNNSVKKRVVVATDSRGIATANLYSSKTTDTGSILVTVRGAGGAELDVNPLRIEVKIEDESHASSSGGDNSDNIPDYTGEDDPGDGNNGGTSGTSQGSILAKLNFHSDVDAVSGEISYAAIDQHDSRNYCEGFLNGNGMVLSADGSGTAKKGVTFNGIDEGKKAVVWVYGLDRSGKEDGSMDCVISDPIQGGKRTEVNLQLNPPPLVFPDVNQSYDTQIHLDLSSIMPPSWKKWFDLIDGLFISPVGTAIYYAVYAWEYGSNKNGGGSTIDLKLISINVWEAMIRGKLDHDPSLPELLRNCDITPTGSKTGSCPSYTLSVSFVKIGTWELFPLAVNAAEDAIEGLTDLYADIKTVGNDIVTVAKKFDMGARFAIQKTGENTVKVKEDWTHVVWTWKLGEDCSQTDKTCGRHAFQLARKADLSDSFVNLEYDAELSTKDKMKTVSVTLPQEHSFMLKYGKLIRILLNNVVAVQVIAHDDDGLDSDGEAIETKESGADLGDLLNYWIPCGKISTAVYNWIEDKTANWEVSGLKIGALITSFLTEENLKGYCKQGIDAAANVALDQLDKLMVDANVKVRSESSFKLTTIKDGVPEKMDAMKYLIGVTVTSNGENDLPTEYNAQITGEGILENGTPASATQCEKFLTLNYDAAAFACGGE